MVYPQMYHDAMNGLIHDPYKQRTRDDVAKCLRYYRTEFGRSKERRMFWGFNYVGWPVKERPNGRYR